MSNKEKILNRAKALFAMSQQQEASPQEAEIAMRRVQFLMAKHGLTVDDLQQKAYSFDSEDVSKSYAKAPVWYGWLAVAAASLTETKVSYVRDPDNRRKMKIRFMGMNGESAIAVMTFEYLIDAMNRNLKSYKKETGTKNEVAESFRRGFAIEMQGRVNTMVDERKEQEQQNQQPGTGLVVSEAKQDLISEEFGLRVSRSRRQSYTVNDNGAFNAGKSAANRTSLNRQMSGSSQRRIA